MLTRDEFQALYEQGPDAVWEVIERLQAAVQPLPASTAVPKTPDTTETEAQKYLRALNESAKTIRPYLRDIHSREPVMQIALSMLRGTQPNAAELNALFATLETAHLALWRHRIVAAWTLSHSALTENQRANLTRYLCNSLHKRVAPSRLHQIQVRFLGRMEGEDMVCLAFLLALERLRAADSIEILAAITCLADPELRAAAERALIAVLPTLTAEHYGRFSSETIPKLCRILTGARPNYPVASEALILATLNALEKMGDGRAVAAVRHTAAASFASCQQEARRILPLLLERQERERHSGMLLRASIAPETGKDELLRPAVNTTTAPEQLLRPATPAEMTDTETGHQVSPSPKLGRGSG